jgi:hypothetical protein
MDSKKDKGGKKMSPGSRNSSGRKGASPGWASGLRQLYDSVLDEPLPDNFKDLISKLDKRD